MYVVISDITNFRRHLAADLPLDSQVPLFRVRIAEVGGKLGLRGEARISFGSEREKRGRNITAILIRNSGQPSCIARRVKDGRKVRERRASLDIGGQVVIGEVIGDTETAANYSFVLTQ